MRMSRRGRGRMAAGMFKTLFRERASAGVGRDGGQAVPAAQQSHDGKDGEKTIQKDDKRKAKKTITRKNQEGGDGREMPSFVGWPRAHLASCR